MLDLGLTYPLFIRLELRYTKPGAPFEVTARHPDTCNHFHPGKPGSAGASAHTGPAHATSSNDSKGGKPSASSHCHSVPVTNSVFSGLLGVAKDISSSCAVPGSRAGAGAGVSVGGGGGDGDGSGGDGVTGGATPIVPPSFSTIYLRRDETRGDVTSGADISLSERVVLRVVCVTLPNLKRRTEPGETGIKRVPALVPFRWVQMRMGGGELAWELVTPHVVQSLSPSRQP